MGVVGLEWIAAMVTVQKGGKPLV